MNADQSHLRITINTGCFGTSIGFINLNGVACSAGSIIDTVEVVSTVCEYLKAHHNLLVSNLTAEIVIREIGSALLLDQEQVIAIEGDDLTSGLPRNIELSSIEVREAISEKLDQLVETIQRYLTERFDVPPDSYILLGGHLQALKKLDQRISKATGLRVVVGDSPDTKVGGHSSHFSTQDETEVDVDPTRRTIMAGFSGCFGTSIGFLDEAGKVRNVRMSPGWVDIVQPLAEYLKSKHNLLISHGQAEHILILIGSALPMERERMAQVSGRNLVTGLPARIEISSIEVREAIFEKLERLVEAVAFHIKQNTSVESDTCIVLKRDLGSIRKLDQRLQEATGLRVVVE